MTVTCSGDPSILEQMIKQLAKLVDVVQAIDHTTSDRYETEIALIKIRCTGQARRVSGLLGLAVLARTDAVLFGVVLAVDVVAVRWWPARRATSAAFSLVAMPPTPSPLTLPPASLRSQQERR